MLDTVKQLENLIKGADLGLEEDPEELKNDALLVQLQVRF